MRRNLVLIAALMFAISLFIWGSYRQATQVNTNLREMDQSAYMDDAKNIAQSNIQFIGGRNRMPLYPVLMSLFYKKGMSDEVYFDRGKIVGIIIGVAGLGIVWVIFNRISKPADSLTATLVTAFTVFAYKSPYFQTEVLFYVIGLVLFWLLLSLISKPNIKTAAIAGFVGGIGHLTKASILPIILYTTVLLLLRGVYDFWFQNRKKDTPANQVGNFSNLVSLMICAGVLLGSFLLVIFPYIRISKAVFGRYFYNVNSTFYMWCDSWEQAEQSTKAHGDRVGWPDMPAEDIPSFQKYIKEHTLLDIVNRIIEGSNIVYKRISQSYGYAEFFIAYLISIIVLLVQNRTWAVRYSKSQIHPCLAFFIIGYFLGYLLLYTWYAHIAPGNRFVLSLFLPAMLLNLRFLAVAQDHQLTYKFFKRSIPVQIVSPVMLLFLFSYLLVVYPNRISTMFGGR